MSTSEAVGDLLCTYYDSLSNGDVQDIARYFDDTAIFISLAGSAAVTGAGNIDGAFREMLASWDAQGLSSTIGYDRSQFQIDEIQDNAALARTRLTKFTRAGETFESWDCTYVLCEVAGGWKISLVTFNDKASAGTSGL